MTTTTTTAIPGYVAGTWDIDPAHSEVGFTVRHMMVSKVRGRFGSFTGTITTADRIVDSTVAADIELSSITTGNEQRDAHLRSADFFATDEHPLMVFRSTGIRAHGDRWIIAGELSLNGIAKPVELETEFHGIGPDAFGPATRAGFTATTSINRKDFGVNWNAAIEGGGVVVSERVDITLEIEAILRG